MTKYKNTRKKAFFATSFLIVFVLGQMSISTLNHITANEFNYTEISSNELIHRVKEATNNIGELFNEREGLFLWNIQNPLNLTRFGDNSDLTNSQESLENLNYQHWLEALSLDVSMQYLLLKNYVEASMQLENDYQENISFYREWMFLTERIVFYLYNNLANSDSLMNLLILLSPNDDILGEYWNTLIRPKVNSFLKEKIALLPDTLVLGSKILYSVELMPINCFSSWERLRLKTLSQIVSDWWNVINRYALYDPEFAIAGIGHSKFYENKNTWTSWDHFKKQVRSGEFNRINILEGQHYELLRYLYTSPEIANQYIDYIKKTEVQFSYLWYTNLLLNIPVSDTILKEIYDEIINQYSNHIIYIRNAPVYVFDPRDEKLSWTLLQKQFSGFTYYRLDYLVDIQGHDFFDFSQYLLDNTPLKVTEARTYQGAGDIRGLMEIYKLLTNGFSYNPKISNVEKTAMNIIFQILDSKRRDSSYILSPYFGNSLDESVISLPLFTDAELLYPNVLPENLNTFTGSLTVLDFLIEAQYHIEKFGFDESITVLRKKLATTIDSMLNLIKDNIDPTTLGIRKQSIIGITKEKYYENTNFELYSLANVYIQIIIDSNIPTWVLNYDPKNNIGLAKIYEWDYLGLFKKVFLNTNDLSLAKLILDVMKLFYDDYSVDNQYQLLSVCEAKDAITRAFFKAELIENKVQMVDSTGIFGNDVPYNYRNDLFPVTTTFASETPQKVAFYVLTILPYISFEEFIINPINQAVVLGFVVGILLSVAVVYIKRPRYQ